MQAQAVRRGSVDERRGQVDPSAGGGQHPFDQISHLPRGEHHRGELRYPIARDEHASRRDDPNFFDAGVVEEGLQRSESSEGCDDLPRGLMLVGDQRKRAAQCPLAVTLQLVAHILLGERVIRGQVDALTAQAHPHVLGDDAHGRAHASMMLHPGPGRLTLSTADTSPAKRCAAALLRCPGYTAARSAWIYRAHQPPSMV